MKIERTEKFSFNILPEKEIKSLSILELIRKKKTIARKDIAENTGIKMVSVFNYMKDYIKESLILEGGIDISTGGRKPELFQLNVNDNYVIGMEIGQNMAKALVMDIGLSASMDTCSEKTYAGKGDIASSCIDIVENAIQKSNIERDKIKGIGVALSENIKPSVIDGIKNKTGLDLFFCDIPTCGAFAERYLNNSAAVEDLLYICSDLAAAVILKGENLRPVTDEESGYLKPWNKNFGMVKMAAREVSRGVGTKIVTLAGGNVDNITDDIVIEAARQGDDVASNVMYSTGVNAATRIAYLMNLFSPHVVVLGAGLEKAGDLILKPIKQVINKLALKSRSSATKIMLSELNDKAMTMGAASLAVREIFLRA